jgi:hypothetical protein
MDNSLQAKLERMAFTITKLRNQISTEKDFSRKMELKASLKRTIDNFNDADLENRLKKLMSASASASKSVKKGGRKSKSKTRKSKTRKSKMHKL